jgi:phage-related protein
MADGYLTFDTKMNTSGFKNGASSLTSVFSKLGGVMAGALSVAAVVAFGKAAVKAAGDAEAKFKGLEFLMRANGRSMSQATTFIQGFTADGLVPMTSAYEAYKNMVSRGYDTSQIEQMMTVMKDAAVYNRQGQFSMGEAMEKATMGLRMENSLLTDSVGIQKNVAKMWQEYAQSIGTTANNLTLAQKRQAEFNGFMKEGSVFAGAAAEYTNTYAGRMSQITSSFTNLKVSVGNAIIPVLNAILPAINAAILWFTKLFNIVGQVINLLFGTNVGMADAEAAIAGSAEQTAAATGETAANTEAAGKAAKGALASFDKLNVLSQKTSEGGGGGGGGGGGSLPGMPTEEQTGGLSGELSELQQKLSGIVDLIKNSFAAGDFSVLGKKISDGVIGALQRAREAIQGFDFKGFGSDVGGGFNKVVSSINTFLSNIDFKTVGKEFSGLLSDVFKGGLDTAIGFLQEVDWQNVGTTIWTGIQSAIEFVWGWITGVDWGGIISRVFELLGSALGAAAGVIVGLATAIWETLKSAWATVKEKWNEFKDEAGGDIWGGIKEGIANAAIAIYEFVRDKVVKPFIDGFKKAFGIASPSTVMEEQGVNIIDGMKKGIEDAWNNAKKWFTDKIIAPLKEWFTEAWEDIKKFASDAWTKIEEVWTTVSTWFKDNVTEPVKTFFSDVWEDIKGFFTGAWDDIKLTWETVSTWFYDNVTEPVKTFFSDTWEDISTKVTGVWEDIKTAWNEATTWFNDTIWQPIKDKAGEVWDSIKIGAVNIGTDIANGVISAVNGVIGFINSMIDGLENAINGLIDLANRLPLINIPNIDLPSIKLLDEIPRQQLKLPALATGAVIPPNAPFAAIMGDQRSGTNIEAPEALIRQIVREEAGNAGGQNITITFGGTMGELVRQLKPHIERESIRAGGNMMAKAVRV